jgi:hypothetical protein
MGANLGRTQYFFHELLAVHSMFLNAPLGFEQQA